LLFAHVAIGLLEAIDVPRLNRYLTIWY